MQSAVGIFIRRLILFCSPALLLIIIYFAMDPFNVLYMHTNSKNNSRVNGNRDVHSSRLFILNDPKYHYDAYIFGSSKSLFFLTSDWNKFIKASHPFHFDASAENLYGVYTKLKYIDNIKDTIKDALIVCDKFFFKDITDEDNFLYKKDYLITGSSPLAFQLLFFKSFFSEGFFITYIDYSIFGKYRGYMKNKIREDGDSTSCISNDFYCYKALAQLKTDSIGFYNMRSWQWYKRPDSITYSEPAIYSVQLEMLQEIKEIFVKNKTNYKFIISPLYSEEYFNRNDKQKLIEIFGKENVYDFSGKNKYTTDESNYFDNGHYKYYVAKDILQEVYSK